MLLILQDYYIGYPIAVREKGTIMLKFIGFEAQSGTITDERTGEVRPWSNRFIICVTDQGLESNCYGLGVSRNKIKSVDICRCFGISFNTHEVGSPSFEERVNRCLNGMLQKDIEFNVGIVKGAAEIIGFRVIPTPPKH